MESDLDRVYLLWMVHKVQQHVLKWKIYFVIKRWKTWLCTLGSCEGMVGWMRQGSVVGWLGFVKPDLPAGLWLALNMLPLGDCIHLVIILESVPLDHCSTPGLSELRCYSKRLLQTFFPGPQAWPWDQCEYCYQHIKTFSAAFNSDWNQIPKKCKPLPDSELSFIFTCYIEE